MHHSEEYDSPPQYELPPPSAIHSSPAALASSDTIHVALSAFSTLSSADIGDVLHPHLSFIFTHLSTASLHSLITAAGIRQQWRLLPHQLIERIVPLLPIHSYLALAATSRHYRAVLHQPRWQRLQHIQLTGRSEDNLNQHIITLLNRSLPHATQLTLRSFPLTPLFLLSLDRLTNLRSLHLTHCSIAASAASVDVWLALGSSSTLRRLHALRLEAVSGCDDESLFQLVVDDGKHPCTALTSLHLTSLQLSSLCGPALASLSRCFPTLAELSLAHNEELSDSCILSMAASPPPLTSLSLAHCPMVSMASLTAMGAFPALSKLDVTSCFQLTSLAPLASLPITSLSVAYTAIAPSTFTTISHLPLRYLHLSTPAAALPAWLAASSQQQQRRSARLHLRWDEAEDSGLGWMAAMGVVELELKGKRVTDDGLVKLISGYLEGGRVKEGVGGMVKEKERVQAGVEQKVVEERKEKEKERSDSKGKSWFSRIKSSSTSSSSSSPSSSSAAVLVQSPSQSLIPPQQSLPLVYLSSSLLPPPPLRLQRLVLRDVSSVSDVGVLRCLNALLPLGLADVEILQCRGVSWKVVEWLMNWRRERCHDVRVLYEL